MSVSIGLSQSVMWIDSRGLEFEDYNHLTNIGLIATNGKDFALNINEFGLKS